MSFGLLAVVAYRAFVFHESSWDLMALGRSSCWEAAWAMPIRGCTVCSRGPGFVRRLRGARLVRHGTPDQELVAVFTRARDEDQAWPVRPGGCSRTPTLRPRRLARPGRGRCLAYSLPQPLFRAPQHRVVWSVGAQRVAEHCLYSCALGSGTRRVRRHGSRPLATHGGFGLARLEAPVFSRIASCADVLPIDFFLVRPVLLLQDLNVPVGL